MPERAGAGRLSRQAAACAALLSLLVAAFPFLARAAAPDLAAMTGREIALLQFYGGGSPLTEAEKREAGEIVRMAMKNAPAEWIAADKAGQRLLAALGRGGPAFAALVRESGRTNAALLRAVSPALAPEQRMEEQIIAAHDPVILLDEAHHRLISAETVRIFRVADTAGASLFGVPGPGAGFPGEMRATLLSAYPGMDPAMQDATGHIERDLPFAASFLKSANPQKLALFVRTYRAKILAAPNRDEEQLRLSEVMAMLARAGFRRAEAQAAPGAPAGAEVAYQMLQEQMMLGNTLTGAARSYSPACAVTSPDAMDNFASCHPYP